MPVGPMSRMFDLVSSTSFLPALLADLDALVVVVDGDRQLLLGLLLADHVLVEELLDLVGDGQARLVAAAFDPAVVGDDVVADVHALVADEDGGAGDQLADVVLVLVAEGAAEDFAVPGLLHRPRFVRGPRQQARSPQATRSHFSRLAMTWSTRP